MEIAIFANGELASPEITLHPETMIIAADGGSSHCLRLGLNPQVVIGDFDSLSEKELAALEAAGATLVRHPTAKDETDLELALDYALQAGAAQIRLYGLLGGRWDMSLANIMLLAAARYAGVELCVIDGNTEMRILRGGATLVIDGQPGDAFSAIPLSANVSGLSYQGLEWPLEQADLPFGTPRGVSNTLTRVQAQISLKDGVLLCVHIRKTGENERRTSR